MSAFVRLTFFLLLLAASLVTTHSVAVVAQTEAEEAPAAPDTFVPSEKLPSDSAISFPVDI